MMNQRASLEMTCWILEIKGDKLGDGDWHLYTTLQMALVVNNLPANTGDIGMWVQFLSQEDPLEKGMATHTSILACRIPRAEEPGRLQFIVLQSQMWQKWLCTHAYLKYVTNKSLLYSTENSTPYSVMTHLGKESKKEWIYVKWLSDFSKTKLT